MAHSLYAGVYGNVYALRLSDWSDPWPKPADIGGPVNVSLLASGGRLFAGCNGAVFELNPANGPVLHQMNLAMLGGGQTDLVTDGSFLYAGVHGYAYGIRLSDWTRQWYTGVGGTTSFSEVNVLLSGGRLYVGTNGYVYDLDPASGKVAHQQQLSTVFGGDVTRLATNGKFLYVGVHGYVYWINLATWEDADYVSVSLGIYRPVSVAASGGQLVAGSNGYVFLLDPASNTILQTMLLTWPVGVGNYDTRLIADGNVFYAGAHGYEYKVFANPVTPPDVI